MATYNDIISRDSENDPLIPEEIAQIIVEEAIQESIALTRGRRVPMSRKKARQPVLDSLPIAYWVDGDTGIKRTSAMDWTNKFITAEELAVIVPIPDAYVDDADIPLWDEAKKYVKQAIGKVVDEAVLFGLNSPASFPDGLVPGAIAAGNVIESGTGVDFGQDVAMLGEAMAEKGYEIASFASRPGLKWKLVGLRDQQDRPIYGAPMAEGQPGSLYGEALDPVKNGSWDTSAAELLAVDWTKVAIGLRDDIKFKIFEEGVISDDEGLVVLNLMQQDAKALRVVMRVGYQTANPISGLDPDRTGYPAGVITPASA